MEPVISVIIPVRNEEKFITQCLDSLLVADLQVPYEIIVIDGMSDDATVEIVTEFTIRHSNIVLLENPDRIVPYALNIGINKAKGKYIARIDAHSVYPVEYLQTLFDYIEENKDVANVGAAWEVLPGNASQKAAAIALASSHPLGIGNAQYRLGCKEVKEVDTVPFGFYRKEIFIKYGFFDTDLVRNQDDEFNHRLIKAGEKIVLLPKLRIQYFARATFTTMSRMYYQYGYFKPLVVKKIGGVVTLRQLAPLCFYCLLATLAFGWLFTKNIYFMIIGLAILVLYLSALVCAGLQSIIKKKISIKCWPLISFAFLIIHAAYAVGYFNGIVDFLVRNKRVNDLPLTR